MPVFLFRKSMYIQGKLEGYLYIQFFMSFDLLTHFTCPFFLWIYFHILDEVAPTGDPQGIAPMDVENESLPSASQDT